MRYASALLLCLLASCGMSREPSYATLAPVEATATTSIVTTLKVQRPAIPATLDRPEMVSITRDHEVEIDDAHHWAEPLDTMIERTLTEDLQQRLPQSFVGSEDGGEPEKSCTILATTIQHFNRTESGHSLRAQLVLKNTCGCDDSVGDVVMIDNYTTDSTPASLSQLLGLYADRVVVLLQKLPACTKAHALR